MDLLARMPSSQDRLMQILSLQNMVQPGGDTGSTGSALTGAPVGSGGSGTTVVPNGDTKFPYQEYARPYSGVPDDMVTKKGITLQRGAMKSLWQMALESKLMKGVQEIGQINQGYRSYADQAAAGGTPENPGGNNPNATTAGNSYHGQGLAIDAAWWTDHPELAQALGLGGWNQLPSESWHWSYGVSG